MLLSKANNLLVVMAVIEGAGNREAETEEEESVRAMFALFCLSFLAKMQFCLVLLVWVFRISLSFVLGRVNLRL